MVTCPSCGEAKRVVTVVAPPSERFPKPIWKYECRVCTARWIVDENAPEGSGRGSTH